MGGGGGEDPNGRCNLEIRSGTRVTSQRIQGARGGGFRQAHMDRGVATVSIGKLEWKLFASEGKRIAFRSVSLSFLYNLEVDVD
jgi:hypothetical protein